MNDDESIEEELRIAEEQDSEYTQQLSSEIFKMTIDELKLPRAVCVELGTPLSQVVSLMQERKFGSLLVTHNRRLAGIITERDILMKVTGLPIDLKRTPVEKVMTPDPISLKNTDMIAYAMNNMHVGGYRHVPIVDDNDVPICVVSVKDVVGYILEHFPNEILNITGEPYRGVTLRESA